MPVDWTIKYFWNFFSLFLNARWLLVDINYLHAKKVFYISQDILTHYIQSDRFVVATHDKPVTAP